MEEKLLKPISEVTYLTTDNAWRYRSTFITKSIFSGLYRGTTAK